MSESSRRKPFASNAASQTAGSEIRAERICPSGLHPTPSKNLDSRSFHEGLRFRANRALPSPGADLTSPGARAPRRFPDEFMEAAIGRAPHELTSLHPGGLEVAGESYREHDGCRDAISPSGGLVYMRRHW